MTQNPIQPLDILVIATHPDDAEIGVGGTLARCGRAGLRTGILDLTNGEPTPHGSPELRARETAAASEALGLTWRKNLGLPNRSVEAALEARRALASVLRTVRPRYVFAPYWDDSHPDLVWVRIVPIGSEDVAGPHGSQHAGERPAGFERGFDAAVGKAEILSPSQAERFAGGRGLAGPQFRRTMRRRLAVRQVEDAGPQAGPPAPGQGAADADFGVVGVGGDHQNI